jgi:hypothetical protein
MNRERYRYDFDARLPFQDVEESLLLAVLATECLHGRTQVRLDASFCLDPAKRTCVVDAATDVGQAIARIFTVFLIREFGEEDFKVERIESACKWHVAKNKEKDEVKDNGSIDQGRRAAQSAN